MTNISILVPADSDGTLSICFEKTQNLTYPIGVHLYTQSPRRAAPKSCPTLKTPSHRFYGLILYLKRDDDGLEIVAPLLYVVADLFHVDVVQGSVDFIHYEERGRSEATNKDIPRRKSKHE